MVRWRMPSRNSLLLAASVADQLQQELPAARPSYLPLRPNHGACGACSLPMQRQLVDHPV